MMAEISRRATLLALPLVACGRAEPARPVEPGSAATAGSEGPGFALVELFSSEGCSSCPPADQVLASLVQEGHERVFPVAFHVDYWDELGWPDPFGSPEFTRRQQEYARALRGQGLYTPQAVVNGREEMVGSERRQLRAALERALARPARASIALADLEQGGGRVSVSFRLQGEIEGARLFLAAVQRGAVSRVSRGENAGSTLRHEAVARSLAQVEARSQGEASVPLVSGVTWLVAWVQRPGREVLGATRVALGA